MVAFGCFSILWSLWELWVVFVRCLPLDFYHKKPPFGWGGCSVFTQCWWGDKGRLIPAVSPSQVSPFGDSALCRQVLVTPWWESRTRAFWHRVYVWRLKLWRWVEGFLGGGISFYLKQTWLTDGAWPHCGQNLEQLVIWLFHVQNAANLRPLWMRLIKGNRLWWILFPLLCETVCHLSNAHKDSKAADRRLPPRIWKLWFELVEPVPSTHLGFNRFGWIPMWLMHIFLRSEAFRSGWADRIGFIIRVNPSTMPGHWIKPESIHVFALLRSKY